MKTRPGGEGHAELRSLCTSRSSAAGSHERGTRTSFGRLQQIEHEMHELEHRMADAGDELDKVLERYSDLQHEYEREGGFEYSHQLVTFIKGLGGLSAIAIQVRA